MMWEEWDNLARYRPGKVKIEKGDRLRSPCGNGLVVEVVDVLSKGVGGYPISLRVRSVGQFEEFERVMSCDKSRNDFPSWTLYRLKQ